MSDRTPTWFYLSDLALKLFAMLGAVYMFREVTYPTAMLGNRATSAEAQTAELEARKNAKPVLLFKPVISQTPSHQDVRALHFEAQLTNGGLVDVPIQTIEVEVYHGRVSERANDALSRTQKLSQLWEYAERSDISEQERQKATEEYQQLHTDCPHERMFLIARESSDITWEAYEDLNQIRTVDLPLQPQQSTTQNFDYLLTESPYVHARWIRLVVVVNRRQETEQRFECVVPMKAPVTASFGTTQVQYTVHQVRPTSRVSIEPQEYYWTPEYPIAPSKPESKPSKE